VLNETFDLFIELGATRGRQISDHLCAGHSWTRWPYTELARLTASFRRHLAPNPARLLIPMHFASACYTLVTMIIAADRRRRVFAAGSKPDKSGTPYNGRPESAGWARYLYTFQGLNKVEVEEATQAILFPWPVSKALPSARLCDPTNPIALPLSK